MMGVEPTSSAWKADALTVVLHLQIRGGNQGGSLDQSQWNTFYNLSPMVGLQGLEPGTVPL